jgi:hypothetical protein
MSVSLRNVNFQPFLGVANLLTIVAVILKLIRKVLGFNMVPHLVPSSMLELQTYVAFPLTVPSFFDTEHIEIIWKRYIGVG